jgi:hypothetical protein
VVNPDPTKLTGASGAAEVVERLESTTGTVEAGRTLKLKTMGFPPETAVIV